jgi:hypothetical protein
MPPWRRRHGGEGEGDERHILESAVLREMIERTLFSVCNDETRFHLDACTSRAMGPGAAWCRPPAVDSAVTAVERIDARRRGSTADRRTVQREGGVSDTARQVEA